MADDPAPPSRRRAAREAARAWRTKKRSGERSISTFSPPVIPISRSPRPWQVSVAAVRREIEGAIVERRLDAPDRYIHVQVARLTKALRAADDSIERGDLKAVAPFVKLVAALDRYHGLAARSRPAPPAALAPPRQFTPSPPLALTHVVTPLDDRPPRADDVAENGA